MSAMPPRTQESRSAAARAQLVKGAIELLSELGVARATTAAIASKAGMTTGALHHHFPTKEALFVAVLDELTEQALALFRNLGHTHDGSHPLARAIVMELWSLYGSTQYWAVWEINMGYRANEAMHRQLVEHRRVTRERMYQALQANEILSAETKEALLASLAFILSALRGIFLDTFYAENPNDFPRTQLAELVAVLERRLAATDAPLQLAASPEAGAFLA